MAIARIQHKETGEIYTIAGNFSCDCGSHYEMLDDGVYGCESCGNLSVIKVEITAHEDHIELSSKVISTRKTGPVAMKLNKDK